MAPRQNRKPPSALDGSIREEFETLGFLPPITLFRRRDCERLLRRIRNDPAPILWEKGLWVSSRAVFEIATRSEVLDTIETIMGENIMLWGASLLVRFPGQVHPWHTDVETSAGIGQTVSVWVGLENTSRGSSLRLVSHSHRFGRPLQQVAYEAGKKRRDVTTCDVVDWSGQTHRESRLVHLNMSDGDALFFDGRLWHGSKNTSGRDRTALLLQYATPNAPIRLPSRHARYEWPFDFSEKPRPPCMMVRGKDRFGINELVTRQPAERGAREDGTRLDADPIWPCWIRALNVPTESSGEGWKAQPVFRGATGCMREFESHLSVLSPGTTPHAMHRHPEEELVVPLSGRIDIVTRDSATDGEESRERVGPGSFAYYSASQLHTISSVGPESALYLVFKWLDEPGQSISTPLKSAVFHYHDRLQAAARRNTALTSVPLLSAPTKFLRKLHSHVTLLERGAGYHPHRDPYDVVIVVLEGMVETLGRRLTPYSVIFYAANELHGMRNVGDGNASYLVFEFHGGSHQPAFHPRKRTLWRRGRSFLRRNANRWLQSVSRRHKP